MKEDKRAYEQAKAQFDSVEGMVNELRTAIDLLEVSVRSDWHSPGSGANGGLEPAEYRILLCTGGPAVQITGDLNQYNEPESATLEYQDWFTAWEKYPLDSEQEETLLEYAQQFYFGE